MKDEILSRIQKKFPLVAKPFEAIANELGISENEVLEILQEQKKELIANALNLLYSYRKTKFRI